MSIFRPSVKITQDSKYSTYSVATNGITREEIIKKNAKLAYLFDICDKTNNDGKADGVLDVYELADIMKFYKDMDSNRDGKISNKEFQNATSKSIPGLSWKDYKAFIKAIGDISNDKRKTSVADINEQIEKEKAEAEEKAKALAEAQAQAEAEAKAAVAAAEQENEPESLEEEELSDDEKFQNSLEDSAFTVSNEMNKNGTINGKMKNVSVEGGRLISFTVVSETSGKEFEYVFDNKHNCYKNVQENKYYKLEDHQLVRDNSIGVPAPVKEPELPLGVMYMGQGRYSDGKQYEKVKDKDGNMVYQEVKDETPPSSYDPIVPTVSPATNITYNHKFAPYVQGTPENMQLAKVYMTPEMMRDIGTTVVDVADKVADTAQKHAPGVASFTALFMAVPVTEKLKMIKNMVGGWFN